MLYSMHGLCNHVLQHTVVERLNQLIRLKHRMILGSNSMLLVTNPPLALSWVGDSLLRSSLETFNIKPRLVSIIHREIQFFSPV